MQSYSSAASGTPATAFPRKRKAFIEAYGAYQAFRNVGQYPR
jgi:hypothetical protein